VPASRTSKTVADELPGLLKQHGVSLRSLAAAVGVNQSYLSRILGSKDPDAARGASAKLAAAIAEYFDLPEDYFGEYRQAVVQDAIAADPKLRDRVYDSLKRKPRR
jgi:transcriptional regulator with XRE-family HTH domain